MVDLQLLVFLAGCFFCNDSATTHIYTYEHTLSLHDALPIFSRPLPSDFDILRPCSSTVNPCVRHCLYGAALSIAMPVSSDDWNQPRCWSEPSRYRSAGLPRPRSSSTVSWVTPESNQTSRMSVMRS